MSETRAVPLEQLVRANLGQGPYPLPLCPACIGGRLYPYQVTIRVGLSDWIEGWVAVCVGNDDYKRAVAVQYRGIHDPNSDDYQPDVEPCGFSMAMTPQRIR